MNLKAGASRVVITPPVGVELAGYSFGPSVGILNDLKAQVLYLECDGLQAAIVTADLLTFGSAFVDRLRRRVEKELGLPGDHLWCAASHSHSSPTAMPLRQWGAMDETYLQALEAHLTGAVAMAQRRAQEASVAIGQGKVTTIAENRRTGHETIDAAVPVLYVQGRDGSDILLWNYGCHPVSLHSYHNLLSPDYPGYAREVIAKTLGRETVAMFALGAAGDINPAGYVAGETSPARSRQIGTILGCEVTKVALETPTEADPALALISDIVALPVEPLPPVAELGEVRDHWAAEAERLRAEDAPWRRISTAEIKRDWAADGIQAQESGQVQETVPCELQAWRLGSAALLAMPLEVFAETALAIKADSPADVTFFLSNTNGGVGYLPTADAYTRSDYTNPEGLAPKVYGLYALSPDAEPVIRQASLQLLDQLF